MALGITAQSAAIRRLALGAAPPGGRRGTAQPSAHHRPEEAGTPSGTRRRTDRRVARHHNGIGRNTTHKVARHCITTQLRNRTAWHSAQHRAQHCIFSHTDSQMGVCQHWRWRLGRHAFRMQKHKRLLQRMPNRPARWVKIYSRKHQMGNTTLKTRTVVGTSDFDANRVLQSTITHNTPRGRYN